MAAQQIFVSSALLVVLLGCARHYREPNLVPGTRSDLTQYVALLRTPQAGKRIASSLFIRPAAREEFLSISRTPDEYQVLIFFCPEAGEAQERRLLEYTGTVVEDLADGRVYGEVRCGYGRDFSFPSFTETVAFVRKAFDVLGASDVGYLIEYTRLRK